MGRGKVGWGRSAFGKVVASMGLYHSRLSKNVYILKGKTKLGVGLLKNRRKPVQEAGSPMKEKTTTGMVEKFF